MPELISAYRPIAGVTDEMVGADGTVKPGWRDVMGALDQLGAEELNARFQRADQYLRDAGVFYRMYEGSEQGEREWPLAHIPLIIADSEWQQIEAGLAQRADLLETVVADIYGENELVREGLLPPELIAANPEFLRPVVGVEPQNGYHLHFCAFELGRGPDGRWWVLGDRTQAPSGAGFALENRVATTRALPDIFGRLHVRRLAGFFRDFRNALTGMGGNGSGRVAILTPGPHNETYFEHAYIARYLGFLLVEGEDMVVVEGQVMVRTISGLKPVSVLWRRLDGDFTDPLELRQDSEIGTPGLAEAVRRGSVNFVNALGAGILETRALAAFLPAIARARMDTDLLLPNIATWWCGGEDALDYVRDNIGSLLIGPAFSTLLSIDDNGETRDGTTATPQDREDLLARITGDPGAYAAQEAVKLSTAPVYVDGVLEPRPITLRVYAARTPNGWSIMPGGFARVGYTLDNAAIAMQRGGQAADVWVVSDTPVEQISLLAEANATIERNPSGNLPSRAGDNLIWLGRYAERCEAMVRILRAYHMRMAETGTDTHPLLVSTTDYLEPLGLDTVEPIPQGLLAIVDGAVRSASQIRDRFSPDGWLALTDLQKTANRFARTIKPGDDATRALTILLRKLAGFSGLVNENMYRFAGWRFLEIGRRVERGIQIADAAAWLSAPEMPDGATEMLLEIGDSVMTHRRRYGYSLGNLGAVELLVTDPLNPRSVMFQLTELLEQLKALPRGLVDGQLSAPARLALQLQTQLAVVETPDVDVAMLADLSAGVAGVSESISMTYFG
ncbi:circularly permuted type 2 ATP-grasp protein [Pelagibacterium montanilacus]|uniref:circularly permuted type 2 ATP-grasp protein n=1 Tax=Pelagibacterium montanilacus TaxID=2185280 RepID=UPI001FE92C75|nr:circularly permuted type 2 ATP-grasp protein [Pelagibacterium montanilacus]